METTFNNVTITIEAENPKAAYAKLCEILEIGVKTDVLEYSTDTFSTADDINNSRCTSELWPQEPEEEEPKPCTTT